jgi:SnoaL-like domain
LGPSRYIALVAVAFVAGGIGVWALSGDGDETSPAPGAGSGEPTATEDPARPQPEGGDEQGSSEAEREVIQAVRRYVEAIDERDGEELCERVAGAAGLDFPEQRGSCAASVEASIGYADPRGFPVFESAKLSGRPEIEVDGAEARATATVITEFADRSEPSVEDDVAYLERHGKRWLLAKPSSTLYRAIGVPDVPPEVLEEP